MSHLEDVQFVGNMNYQFQPDNNLPAHYYPRLRNHENFCYSNPRNALNTPPPDFQGQSSSDYNTPVEKRASTLEDNLNAFVIESRKRMDAYETKALTKAKKETLGERVENELVPFTP